MTTAQALPSYTRLTADYERHLTLHGVTASMLTHKWQPGDLIAPRSDVDVRVIVNQAPDSWWDWNHAVGLAHTQAVAQHVLNRRFLEHPPGFAFTTTELERHRVSPPEIATWSLIAGNAALLRRWKSHAQTMPWSQEDERFYRGILGSRAGGMYQLAKDSIDNVHHDVEGYRGHCVTWHYVAPCWFAAASLATRTRCPGKSAALAQWHPGELEAHAEKFLRYGMSGSAPGIAPEELLNEAHDAVEALIRRVPKPRAVQEPDEADAIAWTMTAGMLRVRVARWLYYLDPPPGTATSYLVAREEKELMAAKAMLVRLADRLTGPEGRLAAAMAALIQAGPTTPAALRRHLHDWHRHRALVEDFFSAHSV
ncbi:hypothetical protein H9Y04_35355 [Streptomyces sp. TRM66268-LWL]|uniref:Nucleotidyltransferase n=1 Tax=Streptomyces polyasparticus TaxID=2767826 RepID=A0ABR7ST86_9ACTN|nr:hypothetical protein [Streptomyces polyasparticus]MBC9717822.1 hypothetical protein [Streptomyces polyasparticus]